MPTYSIFMQFYCFQRKRQILSEPSVPEKPFLLNKNSRAINVNFNPYGLTTKYFGTEHLPILLDNYTQQLTFSWSFPPASGGQVSVSSSEVWYLLSCLHPRARPSPPAGSPPSPARKTRVLWQAQPGGQRASGASAGWSQWSWLPSSWARQDLLSSRDQ